MEDIDDFARSLAFLFRLGGHDEGCVVYSGLMTRIGCSRHLRSRREVEEVIMSSDAE